MPLYTCVTTAKTLSDDAICGFGLPRLVMGTSVAIRQRYR
jgi:hypothetical protein